jgi:23S rRNA pseudouridine2457 synthase
MAAKVSDIPHRYFILNKPAGMVSQFVSPHRVGLLGDLDFRFQEGTHAIGRLDSPSEGLLLLTTNKKITRLLFSAGIPHRREYLVQVNHWFGDEPLRLLQEGVQIRVAGGGYYRTPPCEVRRVEQPETIYPFITDARQFGEHAWLLIALYEGKYRQIRKMIGAVHHRCRRLIRISIEELTLDDLAPGSVREITAEEFFEKLKL